MSFSTHGQAVLSQDRKLVVIFAVLGLATVVIADNFRRYGGAPLDPNPELTAERAAAASRPSYVRYKLQDNAQGLVVGVLGGALCGFIYRMSWSLYLTYEGREAAAVAPRSIPGSDRAARRHTGGNCRR